MIRYKREYFVSFLCFQHIEYLASFLFRRLCHDGLVDTGYSSRDPNRILLLTMTGFTSFPLSDHATAYKRFRGSPYILGPSWSRIPTLTIGLLGVQIFWSVEMGYASPYLLSLGLSKSSLAIVFLAGPLSGLVMQPLIGVLADNSTSRFGRRRPYILVGTIICIFGMLLLGYTRAVAALFTGWDNSKVCSWFLLKHS